jgi:hypothetical protein
MGNILLIHSYVEMQITILVVAAAAAAVAVAVAGIHDKNQAVGEEALMALYRQLPIGVTMKF